MTQEKKNAVIAAAIVSALSLSGVAISAAAVGDPPVPSRADARFAQQWPKPGTKAYSKKFARVEMKDRFNWGKHQYQALLNLWSYESEWDFRSENPSSGAYGIPQSLPANKMRTAGADWKTNPETQILWGLKYIKRTYGSPAAAWQFELANNWY